MGKGSGRRPLLISEQEAEDNWNKIFKKDYSCWRGFKLRDCKVMEYL